MSLFADVTLCKSSVAEQTLYLAMRKSSKQKFMGVGSVHVGEISVVNGSD